jgi:hypothetical protein
MNASDELPDNTNCDGPKAIADLVAADHSATAGHLQLRQHTVFDVHRRTTAALDTALNVIAIGSDHLRTVVVGGDPRKADAVVGRLIVEIAAIEPALARRGLCRCN